MRMCFPSLNSVTFFADFGRFCFDALGVLRRFLGVVGCFFLAFPRCSPFCFLAAFRVLGFFSVPFVIFWRF